MASDTFSGFMQEVNNPYGMSTIDQPAEFEFGGQNMSVDPAYQTDFTRFLDETTTPAPQWSADPSYQTELTGFLSGDMGTPSQPEETGLFAGGVGSILKNGITTVDGWFKGLLGDKGAGMLYASAIMAGAQAILNSKNTDKQAKALTENREDGQAHQKELVTMKYEREDAERARRSAVPAGARKINYNPAAMKGYQVPGMANSANYGLLKGTQ